MPIQDHGLGPPGHQVEKPLAPETEHRPQQFQRGDQKKRDEAGGNRHFFGFNGDGGQIGDEDGGDKLLRLQLSKLALAHQPHGKQHAEIN